MPESKAFTALFPPPRRRREEARDAPDINLAGNPALILGRIPDVLAIY